jgi:methyl-accepting chemotaxis protein
MKNIKISTKLLILVVVMSTIIAITGFYGERSLNTVNDSVGAVYKESVLPLRELKAISDMYAVNIVDAAHKVRNGNTSWETGMRNIKKAKEEIDSNWKSYTATYSSEEERGLANEARQLIEVSNESIESLQRILEKADSAALAHYIKNELYAKIDPVTEKISQMVTLQLKVAEGEFNKSNLVYSESRTNGFMLIISGILIGLVISFIIIRNVANIVAKLKELISFVQVASDNISSASTQMNSSSQQMSEGATEQAASA